MCKYLSFLRYAEATGPFNPVVGFKPRHMFRRANKTVPLVPCRNNNQELYGHKIKFYDGSKDGMKTSDPPFGQLIYIDIKKLDI